MRVVQAFRRERANEQNFHAVNAHYREANQQTVVLNGLYFPFVDFLSAAATAIVLGYGGYLVFGGDLTVGNAVRVRPLPVELLRPRAAALAALQHVPLGRRRAGQDHERHGRGARGARQGRSEGARPHRGRRRLRGRALRLRGRAGGAARHRPRRSRGDDRRARRPHRRGQVDDREAPRALLRPARRPDHDRRSRPPRRDADVAAAPARRRAAGGLPLRRHGARQHRVRPAGRGPGRRGRRREGRRRARVHPRARGRLRDEPPGARNAALARPAAARSPSRGRCSPIRGS